MSNTDGRRRARLRTRAENQALQQKREQMERQRAPVTPLRSINLERVFQVRNRILNEAFYGLEESVLETDQLPEVIRNLDDILHKVDPGTWFDTLRPLVGLELPNARLKNLAWNLAANHKRLMRGEAVRTWSKQRIDEWVPVQVQAAWLACNAKNEPGLQMKLCVLAGSPAGHTFVKFWSRKQCRMFAPALGFAPRTNRDKKAIHLRDLRELVLLRFYVFLDPVRCEERLTFYHFKAPASCKDYNKLIISRRRRRKWKCPKDYSHPCHQCAIGYDTCPVGTHPATYVWRICERCKQNAPFDPSLPRIPVCVTCTQAETTQPHKEDS